MRLGFAVILALGASTALPAQTPTVALPTSAIDVIVEDSRGRALDTLTAAAFSVTERNAPLKIESIQFVRPPRRLVAIYLDEFHVSPGPAADRARDALIDFVRHDLGPDDQVVVLKPLDSLLDIKLIADRDAAARAIGSFDPRRGDYTPRTAFERNLIAGVPPGVDNARAQIAASSLDALATRLGRIESGRKTLIVVSEGFARTGRRRSDLLPNLDSVVLAANRAQVAIYPIEVPASGSAVRSSDADDVEAEQRRRETFRSLATGTTGRAWLASDDLPAAFRQVLADASGYYTLTISQPEAARDGRFHSVEVAVRPAALVTRARPGYWAASDEDDAPVAGKSTFTQSFASQFQRRTSVLIRPWFGMSRGDNGATRVSFVWEPAPRVPGDRSVTPTPARIALTVTKLDGSPVFEGVVLPTGIGIGEPAARQAWASFDSPAGRLLVQMAIEDAGSRVVDRDVRDLVVGGFPGPVTIGSAEVLRARNAREYQALATNPDAAPVASRQFSRAERLLVRVPVFSTTPSPTVSARLVSPLGETMRELVVGAAVSGTTRYQVDVPLAALTAGAYTIELTAVTRDGQARDSLPFRVTP